MSLSQQEWDFVESRLQAPFGTIDLVVDGYMVTLRIEKIEAMRYGIMVYIGGYFKGEWTMKDCEERRRFFREIREYAYPKPLRTKWKKMSKQTLRAYGVDPDKKISFYTPLWPTFGSLKRHLKKHNTQIVLVSEVATV